MTHPNNEKLRLESEIDLSGYREGMKQIEMLNRQLVHEINATSTQLNNAFRENPFERIIAESSRWHHALALPQIVEQIRAITSSVQGLEHAYASTTQEQQKAQQAGDQSSAERLEGEKKILQDLITLYQEIQTHVGGSVAPPSVALPTVSMPQEGAVLGGMIQDVGLLQSGMEGVNHSLALFGIENQALNALMEQTQHLMGVLINLQKIQQAVGSKSIVQLSTLNNLRKWWNGLLRIGIGAQQSDTVASELNSQASSKNSIANSGAALAKKSLSSASLGSAVAEGQDTLAKGANAVGARAATIANITLAGAFRMVGAAIKATPIGWIMTGISLLIGVVSHFTNKAKEAREEAKKKREEAIRAVVEIEKTRAKEVASLEYSRLKVEQFNGSKQQEKKLIQDLNATYGSALGYYKTLAEWKNVLSKKGKAYIESLLLEAQIQQTINKIADLRGQEVEIRQTNPKDRVEKLQKVNEQLNIQKGLLTSLSKQIVQHNERNQIGGYVEPIQGGKERKNLRQERWTAEANLQTKVAEVMSNAEKEIQKKLFEMRQEGHAKEMAQIHRQCEEQRKAWREKLLGLAEEKKKGEQDLYMSRKGATKEGWNKSPSGKKSLDEHLQEILDANPALRSIDAEMLETINNSEKNQLKELQDKHLDSYIELYGSGNDRIELALKKWVKKLKDVPPQFAFEMSNKMRNEVANIKVESFKKEINWSGMFDQLDQQASASIEENLQTLRKRLKREQGNDDSFLLVKELESGIASLEGELDKRNPFRALHGSIQQVEEASKKLPNEFLAAQTALQELAAAEERLQQAQQTLNATPPESDNYTAAKEEVEKASLLQKQAQERAIQAQEKLNKLRSQSIKGYQKIGSSIKGINNIIGEVGGSAAALAQVFSADLAQSITRTIGTISKLSTAAGSIIENLGKMGKTVTQQIGDVVETSAQGITATSTVAGQSISTVEKASVILTIISAAMQAASIIADLLSNDEGRQKAIDNLQKDIDELQWAIDNPHLLKFEESMGKPLEQVDKALKEASTSLQEMASASLLAEQHVGGVKDVIEHFRGEKLEQAAESLADAYAQADYSANKLVGEERYTKVRDQMEKMAKQQISIAEQLEHEKNDAKKKDSNKIDDYEKKLRENAHEMAEAMNSAIEDIIGGSAKDIAQQLGDAFFDAVSRGEDALMGWKKKTDEIVGSIIRRMFITKILEPELTKIFNEYREKWFPTKGFVGAEVVNQSMPKFKDKINQVGESFNAIVKAAPPDLQKIITSPSEELEGSRGKGFATASQESIDELNGRFSALQIDSSIIREQVVDLKGLSMLSVSHLENISKHTHELYAIRASLEQIDRNTQRI